MRGEVYMTKSDFLALNKRQAEAGEQIFANPRNSAAGSLRQKDPADHRVAPARLLRLWLGRDERRCRPRPSPACWNGSPRPASRPIRLMRVCRSVEEMLAFHHDIEEQRATLDYDIDGVVYKVDRLDWQERLGFVSRVPALGDRA